MTCKQLGGACDYKFHGNTFDEMAMQSKQHAMEMMKAGDVDHLAAMKEMGKYMQSPDAMKAWMDERKKEFDALPND